MKNEDKLYLLIIIVAWAIFRFPFLQVEPLQLDEALYAQMTNAFMQHATLQPVFMGEVVSWRPIGYFLINAPFVALGKALALNPELAYRLSSLFFSFLTGIVLYFLVKNMYKRADVAFVAALFYQVNFATVFVSNRGLTDSVLMFFMVSSLYFYFKGKDAGDFLCAGALAFAAYFVKTVMALAVPFLAVSYWFFKDRKALRDKYFLVSLLAVPLAAVLVAGIMQASSSQLGSDISTLLVKFDFADKNFLQVMLSATVVFAAMIGMFVGFAVEGAKKIAGFDPFIIVWLSMLPVLIWGSQVGMPWYLLPAMPAVGIVVAVGSLDKKHKFDSFASAVFAFLVILTLAITIYFYAFNSSPHYEKEAGEFLAGKDNVYVMGYYAPGILFYKNNLDSKAGNLCTIVTGLKGNNNTYKAFENASEKEIEDAIAQAYYGKNGPVDFNTRWTDAFWDRRPLAAGCNGFGADYIVAAGLKAGMVERLGNFTLVKNISGEILIYEKAQRR
ncbi:MAG: glycosyltransferase family 39 protein [Candidatus Micrarchaeia archaeon]